jgi:CRISPR/Cas system-associated exonuclease Cas4 (RecB family)
MNSVLNVSPSQLATFQQCPRKWWALYVKHIPKPPETDAVKLGKALHKILEITLKCTIKNKKKYTDTAYISNIVSKSYSLTEADNILLSNLIANAKSLGWFADYTTETTLEDGFELSLKDDLKINGRFDRVDFTPKYVNVIDLKTGKHPYSINDLKDNWQGKLYALPWLVKGYDMVKINFWFVRFLNGKQNLFYKQSHKNTIIKEIISLVDEMRTCDGSVKCESKLCNYCPFQKECIAMN